ncbi:proteasome beta 4 subunit [Rhizoctonia solani AG-1 IA]|uniref:Proteasome beta 4 subunit n=1 Tax=Thanatephorus cucumeris (strain AG1-IA) TaxID=983506 RepID=L8WUY2_THACA|nr:proteasome beta 4 subunit [Rhizoctonia solani AG-1 IA]
MTSRARDSVVDHSAHPTYASLLDLFTTCIMDHFPTNWGRPKRYGRSIWNIPSPCTTSTQTRRICRGCSANTPIVTGTSVLGIRFKDGVMLAADNLGWYGSDHVCTVTKPRFIRMIASYGSLARFKDIRRLHPVGNYTVIGAGGDMSDFQYLQHLLDNLMIEESNEEDGHELGPKEIYEYLSRVMYARRSKINPLWNSMIVGGFKDDQSFLGYVDLLGTTYSASTIATGYGSMIAIPLLRKAVEGRETTLTEEEGKALLVECMKVLFYRDARSLNKFQIATVTSQGVNISESIVAETEWSFADKIRGYGAQTQ